LSYLDQGLYQLSVASLRRALGKTLDESDLLYYLALALLGGQRPRASKLSTIRQIESYLTTAIRLADRKPHYRLLLATIKSDYYIGNGLNVPPPDVESLLSDAFHCQPNSDEVRLMLKHLSLPPGPLRSVILNHFAI
jgi:hypothetical protein